MVPHFGAPGSIRWVTITRAVGRRFGGIRGSFLYFRRLAAIPPGHPVCFVAREHPVERRPLVWTMPDRELTPSARCWDSGKGLPDLCETTGSWPGPAPVRGGQVTVEGI